jgi:hypothetical protein
VPEVPEGGRGVTTSTTRQRNDDDRLFCTTCKEQPKTFLEIVHWQVNEVDPEGEYIRTREGDISYECPQCGDQVELD